MNILAIDTATEAVSAALLLDGSLSERFRRAPREHARLLLPFVDELLADAGLGLGALDFVAVSRGPGSFTGVRIGFGAAQGIAMGAGLGMMPISTLHALALTAREAESPPPSRVLAALDARIGEIYAGFFDFSDDPLGVAVADEAVIPPLDLSAPTGGHAWFGAGSAFSTYSEVLQQRLGDGLYGMDPGALPRAGAVARIAEAMRRHGKSPVPPTEAQPVYLRHRVADKPT